MNTAAEVGSPISHQTPGKNRLVVKRRIPGT